MRVALICGDQPRHLGLAKRLSESGMLAGAVIQARSKIPNGLEDLPDSLAKLVRTHFALRDEAEFDFFGAPVASDFHSLNVSREELNSEKSSSFVLGLRADLTIVWGTNVLTDTFLDRHESPFWNIHGGLSPNYKGAATMFWPSFMLEPQMTGVTIHEPTSRIDGGPILHQIAAPLIEGDGLQRMSARAVDKAIDDTIALVCGVHDGKWPIKVAQKGNGKLWLESDWRPEHLRVIYEQFGDRIVDLYLEGEFRGKSPSLVNGLQFGTNDMSSQFGEQR